MVVHVSRGYKDGWRGDADGVTISNNDWAVIIDIRDFNANGSRSRFPGAIWKGSIVGAGVNGVREKPLPHSPWGSTAQRSGARPPEMECGGPLPASP